jgi:hypothetical protein
MKKSVLIGGVAAIVVLASGWALAQGPGYGPGFGPGFMRGGGPYGMGPGMMWDGGRGFGPGYMHRGRGMWGGPGWGFTGAAQLDGLKNELAITPAQEAAWTKYAKAVEDAAGAMKTLRDGVDRDAVAKMSRTERYDFFAKVREQRWQQHGAVTAAARELFATLDERQKDRAEDALPGLGGFGAGRALGPGGGFGPGWMHGGRGWR